MSDNPRVAAARNVLSILPLIMRTVGRAMRESASEVSPAQQRLLGFISLRSRTLSDIARMQGVTPATATTLVTTLEHRGWVRRTQDLADRRRVVVSLTGEGREAMATSQIVAEQAVAALLEPLEPGELARLVDGIDILGGLGSGERGGCS